MSEQEPSTQIAESFDKSASGQVQVAEESHSVAETNKITEPITPTEDETNLISEFDNTFHKIQDSEFGSDKSLLKNDSDAQANDQHCTSMASGEFDPEGRNQATNCKEIENCGLEQAHPHAMPSSREQSKIENRVIDLEKLELAVVTYTGRSVIRADILETQVVTRHPGKLKTAMMSIRNCHRKKVAHVLSNKVMPVACVLGGGKERLGGVPSPVSTSSSTNIHFTESDDSHTDDQTSQPDSESSSVDKCEEGFLTSLVTPLRKKRKVLHPGCKPKGCSY